VRSNELACRRATLLVLFAVWFPSAVQAQTVAQRGFVEARADLFPQETPQDATQAIGDLLIREELFVKPLPWLQFAAGGDFRANSHDQVDDSWRLDISDRGVRRPRLSLRRATATIAYKRLTLDVGKQFIRWGKADLLNPTDRFAPRDFLNVVNTEFLPVTGVRAALQVTRADTIDAVWLPRFTPSRVPLLTQRWTAVPAEAPQVQLVDAGAQLPTGSQTGVRWSHVGDAAEYSLSFFDGYNHLPNIDATLKPFTLLPEVDIRRQYPAIRTYGADVAMPTRWFTVKGEAAYFTSSAPETDEYMLYVVQLERQTGEWLLVGGYAGQAVTTKRSLLTFAPDRGLTDSVVGRASYTIDANRSVAVETAVRQNLAGTYGKAEYSQAYGQHWRATVAAVVIGGHENDFLGQYHRNSNVSLALRYSF